MNTPRPVGPPTIGRLVEARRRESIDGERTFDETRELLEEAIEAKLGITDDQEAVSGGVWIRDLSPSAAVYSVGYADDYFQIGYTIAADGTVTVADPAPVEVETTYTPANTTESVGRPKQLHDSIEGRVLEAKTKPASDGGRIFRVEIIQVGDSLNGRRYTESVLSDAAPLYEGAKAYDHHRSGPELASSTITGLVGSYQNVQVTSSALEADLHLLPSAKHTAEALDASLAAVAEGRPPLVGVSHDVVALYQPMQTGGRRFVEATQILKVNSADVVADPAAGGRATRMVAGGSDGRDPQEGIMTLKQLLELLRGADATKRAELLQEHASVLEASGFTTTDVPTLLGETEGDGELAPVGAGAGAAAGEAEGAAAADGGRATEAAGGGASVDPSYERGSFMGRTLINAAIADAGLDARLVESVTGQLPERFTEAQLVRQVEGFKGLAGELERAGLAPRIADVRVTGDELDAKVKRLDAMFQGDFKEGYRSLKHAYTDFTGDRDSDFLGEDFNRKILRESIGATPYDSAMRTLESISSGTWNLVLGDSITRRMIAEYVQPDLQVWRQLVSSMPPVNDFRTQRIDALGGFGTLPAVNEGAPYQDLGNPSNEEATYALTKRGGTFDLTLEAIANDDLGAVLRLPKKAGLAAAQTLFRFVFDMLDTNITCTYDSTALAAAGHGNTAASALSRTALSTIRRKMRAQTARGDTSDFLSLTPKFLVVANTLEELAWEIVTSAVAIPTAAPDGAASNIPNLHQGTGLVTVDYWSSTTEWWAVADSAKVPTIEIGFYQGRQDPEMFVQNDSTVGSPFNADKVVYKIRHIYSGTILDHRAFQRGNS